MFRSLAVLALAALPATLAQISNDFESGWDQTAWPIYAPDCNQGGTVTLDTTTAHSGKNSMKVTSPGGYCGHIFFGTTQVPSGDVYVRVWLKAQTALTSNHVSFITMPDSAQGTGKHLRIGGQSQILMYNRESDDATLPNLSPDGIASSRPLPVNTWTCFEYHLGTDGSIETWLDGSAIPGLTTAASNPYASQWLQSTIIPKITGVYFGWESYGGDVNTFWYDDISIASSRVGCGGSGSTATLVSPTTSARITVGTSASTSARTTMTTTTRIATATTRVATTTTRIPTTTSRAGTTIRTSVQTTIQTTAASGAQQNKWGQCGGTGWTGPTSCVPGSTCTYSNDWYSQCL